MYTMYIMYTVAEFRKNIRQALDEAEHNGSIEIKRHHTLFVVTVITTEDLQDLKEAERADAGFFTDKVEVAPRVIKTPSQALEAVSLLHKNDKGLCKLHGTPLDYRGHCTQKGCKL